MYQFTDFLVVAIKGHGLGSLDAIALQDLERGICIAGGRRKGMGGSVWYANCKAQA